MLWIVVVVGAIVAVVCGYQWQQKSQATVKPGESIPTVFLHGSPASPESLLSLVQRIDKDEPKARYDVTLVVNEDGQVKAYGDYHASLHPLILLVFENSEGTEAQQVEWLADALSYMKTNYHIRMINMVAHSMGGVDIMHYLIEKEPHIAYRVPRLNRVVTLGSNYNGLDDKQNADYQHISNKGLQDKDMTDSYKKMYDTSKKYRTLAVNEWLNIAGDKDDDHTGDHVVPIGSVASANIILKQHHVKYTFKIVPYLDHNELHESRDVDRLIEAFLFNTDKK